MAEVGSFTEDTQTLGENSMIEVGAYLALGGLYAFLENRMFSATYPDDVSIALKWLYVSQMVLHLSRVVITWPLYVAEDFLIFMTAFIEAGDPEGPDDDV